MPDAFTYAYAFSPPNEKKRNRLGILNALSMATVAMIATSRRSHAHTFGATVEEALANAREIIELELELVRERDEEIPISDAGHVVIATITVPPPSRTA